MLRPEDIHQAEEHGITKEMLDRQIGSFKNGFPFLSIDRAATIGDGIISLTESEQEHYEELYESGGDDRKVVKFVPASGAATRMFKDLFEFVNGAEMGDNIKILLENIDKFAFYPDLKKIVGEESDPLEIVEAIIGEAGLNYGALPKGLIKFHVYDSGARTAAEEHLVEGTQYAVSDEQVDIHYTVSGEHQQWFEELFSRVSGDYEKCYGVTYNISYSQQKPGTDTIAVNPDNTPFREPSGKLLFRPAGHGALLSNLNDIDADLIFIKTVDNVAPDSLKKDTVRYKKYLGGIVVELQSELFRLLKSAGNGTNARWVSDATDFIERKLAYKLPQLFNSMDNDVKADYLRYVLNRPIRVCGMVRNEGEPGGGPFWVTGTEGEQTLQIAESSQVSPEQIELMSKATHFNPVDLVCAVRDYQGNKFDLMKYVDPTTGFISVKSKDGRELKAQELPGLWNGAMAHWNTVFVEVPITTFSPVKVVNDLLRPQHRG